MKRKGLTVKFFKWNKILVAGGIIIGIVIISSLAVRWPINTFPAIEGKVLDATTREPLENVVVSVNWIRSSPGPAGEITRTIRRDIVVMDKQGKYRIPRLWSFHLFSVFSRGYMGFYHPLYGSKQAVVARERRKIIIGSPALKAFPEEFEYKDGIIHWDIELLSLEEKYGRAVQSLKLIVNNREREERLEKIVREDFVPFIDAYDNGAYFLICEDHGIRFDLENIFGTWESIARSLSINKKVYEGVKWHITRTKRKIQKKLLLKSEK